MEKFLIINPFGIGDVLFTTPAIRAIKENFSGCFVGFWCNQRVEGILKDNPNINMLFPLSRGDLKKIYQESRVEGIKRFFGLLGRIKKEKFDTALDFSLDYRYSLLTKLIGIRRRIGFDYKKRGLFLTEKIGLDSYDKKHIVEYYLDLLRSIGISGASADLDLFIPENNRQRARKVFAAAGINKESLIIGIAPGAGASWGIQASYKQWPALRFAQLGDMLTQAFSAKIVILGDESERPIADIIINASKHKPLDLVGKTSLEEFAALVGNLNLLITNDGGPMHMAVALGVKTVSIFGPVDDLVYGPYPRTDKHIVIKNKIDCSPCYQGFRMQICDKNKLCLNSITTEEVFEAVRRLVS